MNKFATLASVAVLAVAASQASAAIYDISGAFPVTLNIFSDQLTIPMTVVSGTYDSDMGIGSWSLIGDLSSVQMQSATFYQTFTLNAETGLGGLHHITDCVDVIAACSLVREITGEFNAGSPIVGGLQSWAVSTPNFGTVILTPTLIDITPTPEVPLPAAAWLMGSALLSLAGIGHRRKAAQA